MEEISLVDQPLALEALVESKRSRPAKRQRTPEEQDAINRKMESLRAKKKQKKAERESQFQNLPEAPHRYRPEYHVDESNALYFANTVGDPMSTDELMPHVDDQRIESALPPAANEGVLVYDPDQPIVFPIPDAPKPTAKRESKTIAPLLPSDAHISGPKSYTAQDHDHIRNTALSIGHTVLDNRSSRKNDLPANRPMLRNAVSYGALAFRAVFGILGFWLTYKHMKHVVDDFVVQAVLPKAPESSAYEASTKQTNPTMIRRETKAPVFLAKTIQSNL